MQKLYENWTEEQIRKFGQFLVKTWSAFYVGQKVGKMRADFEDFQAKQSVQKVDRNGTENLRQLFVKVAPIKVHRRFTETSPDFRTLSLETLRYGDGETSVVLNTFLLLPCIAQYMRNVLIQFDIPSSYLYVVVLKKLCL